MLNLILYVNAEEADYRPSAQTRADDEQELAAKKRGKSRPPRKPGRIYDAGRRVKLPGIRGDSGGKGTGQKIRYQFWVRGHWRTYHVGEGRARSVLKWIKPFQKGTGRGLPKLYGRQYEAEVKP